MKRLTLKALDPAQSEETRAASQSEHGKRIERTGVAAKLPKQTDEARSKETAAGADGINQCDGCRG